MFFDISYNCISFIAHSAVSLTIVSKFVIFIAFMKFVIDSHEVRPFLKNLSSTLNQKNNFKLPYVINVSRFLFVKVK